MRLAAAAVMSGGRVPSRAGTPFGGGYYVGRIRGNGLLYALIVAPKAYETDVKNKPAQTNSPSTDSTWDGAANTAAMISQGDYQLYPAAAYCAGLSIGGFSDWVMPAKNQLELIYRNLKPGTNANDTSYGQGNPDSEPVGTSYTASMPAQTDSDLFKVGGSEALDQIIYNSSTQYDAANSWALLMQNGLLGADGKGNTRRLRPVRMIRI